MQEDVEDSTHLSPSPNPPKKKETGIISFWDFTEFKGTRQTTTEDIVNSEIRQYTEEDLLDYDSDPWWGLHKKISYYGKIHKKAMVYTS